MKKKPYGYLIIIILVIILIVKNITGDKANSSASEEAFRDTASLIITHHAKCRMNCREIDMHEIKEIVSKGKLNRSRSGIGAKGDETFALEGYSSDEQHIRVVVAPEENGLVVITCIDLEKEWPCNCN